MSNQRLIKFHIQEHINTVNKLHDNEGLIDDIVAAVKAIIASLEQGGTLFWCGNGGSASDSQHLAAELVGRFKKNRKALRSIALTTDSSILTCVANDFSFDQIFSRQIEGLARPNDVLVGLSTSGNSSNVLKAFDMATLMGVARIGLLGGSGGAALNSVQYPILVPSDSTAHIQESHIMIGHIMCELIEQGLCFA